MGAHADSQLSRLGRYDILGLLATGGMAEIFLARQIGPSGFERPVVVKRVLPHLARQRVFHEMFLDEARIVSRIRHANVVNVHELGDDNNELFLVMEYLEGESLGTLLKHLRRQSELLPVRLAAHMIAEACAGLHAAHELTDEDGKLLDIVHRDVSPQNLFVLYAGQVKVIDFGIAKALDRTASRTQTGQVKGKFAYMAPEQIGSQPLDRRADVFALGAVLHELLTSKKLFGRDHDLLVLKAVCEEPIAPPSASRPEVPKALDDIVMRALNRNRNDRYESAAAMRRDLLLALRALDGDDLPEEALSTLMSRLFSERLARHHDLLKRFRAGQAITHVPTAETTATERTPPTQAEPASRTGIGSPAHTVSVATALPKPSPWGRIAAAGVTLALATSGFGYWIARRGITAPAPPSASLGDTHPAEVTFHVGSTPSGAHVTIGGRDRGLTPLDIQLARGEEKLGVSLSREGYITHEQTLLPDSDHSLDVTLAPAPTSPKAASVVSEPADAKPGTNDARSSSTAAPARSGARSGSAPARPPPKSEPAKNPSAPAPGGFTRFD